MTKKIWLLISMFCLILTGCSDRSYKGYVDMGGEEDFPDEPIPVMVAVGDPSYSVLTRKAGAFDSLHIDDTAWKQAVFYIYAFNVENGADYKVTRKSEANKNNDICLIDGSMDREDAMGGKPARLNQGDFSFLEWLNEPYNIYYNTLHPNLPYKFYAYYVDDLEIPDSEIQRETDRIYFNVEIDGSQDLMSSVAKLTDTQKESIEDKYINNKSEKDKLLNSLYSAYAANRGINPMFTFKHHLSRFKFRIYPGKPEASQVYVDSICMYSHTKGVFTVVSKHETEIGVDFSADEALQPLYLTERGGGDLDQKRYKVLYNPNGMDETKYANLDVYSRNYLPVGESLLVAPDDSYQVIVHLRQEFDDGKATQYYLTEYNLTSAIKDKVETKGFSPGKAYVVRIAIFGVQEVKIQVVAVDTWQDGGYTDINPDDFFEY